MEATNWEQPMICPTCGELVIADPEWWSGVSLPTHPDRLFPFETCEASQMYIALSDIR